MRNTNPGHEPTAEESSEDDGSSASDSSRVGIDETFETLKNSRRRTVLSYLRNHDGSATMRELADFVTADENDIDIEAITSSQRKRVYVSLYQFHLPKMAEMDIINYDKNRGSVSLTDKGRQIWQTHEVTQQPSQEWGYLYLLVGVFGIVGVTASVYLWSTRVSVILFALQTIVLLAIAVYHHSGHFFFSR